MELDKKHNVVVEPSFVKSFVNTKYILARLTKTERFVLDHITRSMNEETNVFVNDKSFRESFNKLFKQIGAGTYTDSTISKAIRKLKELTIIDKVLKYRGAYKVNPLYFVKGSEISERNTHRDKLVREYMEQINSQKLLNRDT